MALYCYFLQYIRKVLISVGCQNDNIVYHPKICVPFLNTCVKFTVKASQSRYLGCDTMYWYNAPGMQVDKGIIIQKANFLTLEFCFQNYLIPVNLGYHPGPLLLSSISLYHEHSVSNGFVLLYLMSCHHCRVVKHLLKKLQQVCTSNACYGRFSGLLT